MRRAGERVVQLADRLLTDPPPQNDEPDEPPPPTFGLPEWYYDPGMPETKEAHNVVVDPDEDPTKVIRAFYKDNDVGPSEWVSALIHEVNPHSLIVGAKDGVHNNGRPIRLEVLGNAASAELQGIQVGSDHGTFVEDLVIDDVSLRNPKFWKAPLWDSGPSGNWWISDCRFYQNLEDSQTGANYDGGKWAIKPDLSPRSFYMADCPESIDPITGNRARWFEHNLYASGIGALFVLRNQLLGANRTAMQSRTPNAKGHPKVISGPCFIVGNTCEAGFDHDYKNGGSAITLWESREGTLIANNVIRSKYGGIAIAHQPQSQPQYAAYPEPHNLALPSGHTHSRPYVLNNEIDTTEGDRSCIEVSSALSAEVFGNECKHHSAYPLTVNSGFAMRNGAPKCGPIEHDMAGQVETANETFDKHVPADL